LAGYETSINRQALGVHRGFKPANHLADIVARGGSHPEMTCRTRALIGAALLAGCGLQDAQEQALENAESEAARVIDRAASVWHFGQWRLRQEW
jgi:hypothetical protein